MHKLTYILTKKYGRVHIYLQACNDFANAIMMHAMHHYCLVTTSINKKISANLSKINYIGHLIDLSKCSPEMLQRIQM